MFTKNDLIKYWGVWYQEADRVCLGAVKYMPMFMDDLNNNTAKFDLKKPEESFRRIIAMAIIYKETYRRIRKEKLGGTYFAYVTNYTIALISHLSNMKFDLEKVYADQCLEIGSEFIKNVDAIAPIVTEEIRSIMADYDIALGRLHTEDKSGWRQLKRYGIFC